MKSYFSRFLYNTLSHSGIREVFTSSLSLSDLIGESSSNQVANLSNLDYRVKPDNDSVCTGRSMVEMLGVLAIIGVLSVGAIAGYSKAMMKYKLNKHAESFNILLNNALQFDSKLSFTPNSLTFYGDVFKKLNLIPDGFKYESNQDLRDMFGNLVWIYHHDNASDSGTHFSAIDYNFNASAYGYEICRNIVVTAKENAADLYYIAMNTYNTDGSISTGNGIIYGDKYCNENSLTCLHDLTLDKIANLCNNCNGESCKIYILLG